MERSTIFKNGKPSIAMGQLYHGYVSHNHRVYYIILLFWLSYSLLFFIEQSLEPLLKYADLYTTNIYEIEENDCKFVGIWLLYCGGKWWIVFVSTLRRRLCIVHINTKSPTFRWTNSLDTGVSENGVLSVLPLVIKRGWKIHHLSDDLPNQISIYREISLIFPHFPLLSLIFHRRVCQVHEKCQVRFQLRGPNPWWIQIQQCGAQKKIVPGKMGRSSPTKLDVNGTHVLNNYYILLYGPYLWYL